MNQETPTLLENMDVLATAPGGVARLRELILSLAVRGKLVPQDPADEPASVLLEKIKAEKERLIGEGKIRRGKEVAVIEDRDEPFGLPVGWARVIADSLFSVVRGVTYSKSEARDAASEGFLPILRANNINGGINYDDLVYVPRNLIKEEQILHDGDYVVCLASGSKKLVGKTARFDSLNCCSFGAFCGVIRPFVKIPYLDIYLASPIYRDEAASSSSGIGINNLRSSTLLGLEIALPPLAEQSRIVARVEESMRLCDALEEKGSLEAAQHARLVDALLGALTASATHEELAAHWQRVAQHFDLLFDRPEAVDALEQTILQLAVRGLLVPQDPTDEPASVLLERIRAEKERLIAEGEIKSGKRGAPVSKGEQPYVLPSRWKWIAVGALSIVGTGTTPARDNSSYYVGGDIPWVTSGETSQGYITETRHHVTDAALRDANLTVYPEGTLIVAMYGQGRTRGQISELRLAASVNQACAAIVLINKNEQHRSYVKLVFESSYTKVRERASGGAQPNLNLMKIRRTPIPLPPMAEQTRIVSRVVLLRRFCADLRQRLTERQTIHGRAAEALSAAASA